MLNLTLPWKRSAAEADEPSEQPSRRRPTRNAASRSRRLGTSDADIAQAARNRRRLDSRRQRIAIVVGAVLILVIVGVVLAGVFQQFILPPRVMAGEVRNEQFSMGDLVERIRVLQGINRYQGGQVDFSRIPFQLLTDLLHAEILRQAAPGLGIEITDEQIDDAIKGQFRPEPEPGQDVSDAQLDAEFDNTYTNFLTQVNLTNDTYHRIMEERLHQSSLFGIMLANLPEEAPQVEIQAVTLSLNSTASPEGVRERLVLGQDFASVAREISGSDGYIGWVPEGAFPEFDRYLFGETDIAEDGSETRKPATLELGEISPPIYVDESIFIIQAIGGPETQEVDSRMLFQMASALVEKWKDDQLQRGSEDGWVKINFDSNRYAWVTDQVRLTRPRVTPQPQQ
ncbi:hypothetical protein GBAR_LOCUS11047 [Geodia barretti]|uniref:PpiC domain-containing protein n=1 Tax=Geodia barretti TaxID=519541 RepID=A0AA35WLG6_GEOBA|nr:hypothetical protein GBAR_LOCUS11047 [Geodia barretti]